MSSGSEREKRERREREDREEIGLCDERRVCGLKFKWCAFHYHLRANKEAFLDPQWFL